MPSWPRGPSWCARCRSSHPPAPGGYGSSTSPARLAAPIFSPAAARISGTPPRSARSRSARSRTRAGRTAASTSPSRSNAMPHAHPEALVTTEWLAAHLDDPHVRVLDSSYKQPGVTPTARQDYDSGHIPGAVFFDIDDVAEPGTSLPHMIPSAEGFPQKMAERGIGNDDRVIVYDTVGLSAAGRAWWMLRLFGHDNVAVLDGGLPKWTAEGRPLETTAPKIPQRRFVARFRPELVRDKAALIGDLGI